MSGASVSPEQSSRLHRLNECLLESPGFVSIIDAVRGGRAATLDGAVGSSCALAAAALVNAYDGHWIIVCPIESFVDDFIDDLNLFGDLAPQHFPAWESDPGQRLVYDEIYGERLRALKALTRQPQPKVTICSLQSLLQPVPPPEAVAANTLALEIGQVIETDEVARWLVEHVAAHDGVGCQASLRGEEASSRCFRPIWIIRSVSNGLTTRLRAFVRLMPNRSGRWNP